MNEPRTGPASGPPPRELGPVLEAISYEVYLLQPGTLRILHANKAAQLALGYSDVELTSTTYFAVTSGSQPVEAVESGPSDPRAETIIELEHRRKDGTTYPVEVRLTGWSAADPPLLVGIARDLTESRRASESLEETHGIQSDEQLRDVIEGMSAGIWVHQAGRIVLVNAAASGLTGYSAEEMGTVEFVRRILSPAAVTEISAQVSRARRARRVESSFETQIQTRDGIAKTLLISVVPIVLRARSATLVSAVDITEQNHIREQLQAAEEKFSKAFHANPLAMILASDENGRIVMDANAACERLLGCSSQEVIGRQAGAALAEPGLAAELWHRVQTEGPVRGFRVEFRTKGGELRPALLSVEPLTLGGRRSVLCVAQDLSEQERLQAQLQQAQKMESIGRLAGGIAHDFNNLLTVITGYGHLAAASLDDGSAAKEDLQLVLDAAQDAAGLTRQLLTLAREQPLAPTRCDLNELIADAMKLLGPLASQDVGVRFQRCSGALNCLVDPGQIEQVLMNMVTNACDAMPGGGQLTIETARATQRDASSLGWPDMQPGSYAVVHVRDAGTGISTEILAKIFDPFFTTKEVGKGTGLGLATSYGIVAQAGGHISVESELGHGTTFKIVLPLAQ